MSVYHPQQCSFLFIPLSILSKIIYRILKEVNIMTTKHITIIDRELGSEFQIKQHVDFLQKVPSISMQA